MGCPKIGKIECPSTPAPTLMQIIHKTPGNSPTQGAWPCHLNSPCEINDSHKNHHKAHLKLNDCLYGQRASSDN